MAYLQNMTPDDLESAIKNNLPLFIATGCIEYHGSQLPLGTDLLIPEGIIRKISERTDIVIAPPFSFCPTGYMVSGAAKGTVDIHIGTFIEYCSQILSSYKKMGFKQIYILVHHQGGNIAKFLECSVQQVNSYNLYEDYGDGWWTENKQTTDNCNISIIPSIFAQEVQDAFFGHGGKGETQPIMALNSELVHMERLSENEAWWNSSAINSDKDTADAKMERLIDLWIERINSRK